MPTTNTIHFLSRSGLANIAATLRFEVRRKRPERYLLYREIMSDLQHLQAANPFVELPTVAPFVLACDKEQLDKFDKKHEKNQKKLIKRDRLPEPRQGPIDAKLFILQANPSFQNGDVPLTQEVINDTHRRLLDEYSLHQGFDTDNPWWSSRYRWLIEAVEEKKLLAKNMCSVELFAYPSARFGHSNPRLPSSDYQLNIVNRAIDRRAIVVVTRSWSDWVKAVPRLKTELDNTVFKMNSPQNVSFSPTNLRPGVFEKIRDFLVRHAKR